MSQLIIDLVSHNTTLHYTNLAMLDKFLFGLSQARFTYIQGVKNTQRVGGMHLSVCFFWVILKGIYNLHGPHLYPKKFAFGKPESSWRARIRSQWEESLLV